MAEQRTPGSSDTSPAQARGPQGRDTTQEVSAPIRVPGRNRTKTYGSELSTIFQILTAVLSAAFPKTMRGCKI